ncbi:MAG: hypothetical protein ABW186_00735 [Rhodanobacteraceae bacterium]
MHFEDGASASAPRDRVSSGAWIEVTGPIADVLAALAKAIQHAPGTLAGASIAVTERETLLLNERAWALFADVLSSLPDLATRPAVPKESRPIRFLLLSGGDNGVV